MTIRLPLPTAPPTSKCPNMFGGRTTSGFVTYPLTVPSGPAVTVMPPSGPSPLNWIVRRSFSFFIMAPIMSPAAIVRPRAAEATGLKLWALRAYSVTPLVVHAKALM